MDFLVHAYSWQEKPRSLFFVIFRRSVDFLVDMRIADKKIRTPSFSWFSEGSVDFVFHMHIADKNVRAPILIVGDRQILVYFCLTIRKSIMQNKISN